MKEGKTQERKVLVFATTSEDSDDVNDNDRIYRSASVRRAKTRSSKGRSSSRSSSTGRRRVRSQGRSTTAPSKKGVKKKEDSSSDDSSSSDEDEDTKTATLSRTKHMLKPPKFDGKTSFATFWAQFKNCAKHNEWD